MGLVFGKERALHASLTKQATTLPEATASRMTTYRGESWARPEMEQQGLHNGEHYSLLDMLVMPVHSRSLSAPLLSCYRFERETCTAIRKREATPQRSNHNYVTTRVV